MCIVGIVSCWSSFTGSVPFDRSSFGGGRGPIFLDEVSCDGTESSLLSCAKNGLGINDCDHTEDAGVRCQGEFYISIQCYW